MKTVEQTRRELFLLKILAGRDDADVSRKADGSYSNYYLECVWQGFNAALDAVVIELPAECQSEPGHTDHDQETILAANCMLDDCRAAIESTNLGLKIR